LVTAGGEVAFALSEFAIPIPKFLWRVLEDTVAVKFHAVAQRTD
jgi:hypothetical protein